MPKCFHVKTYKHVITGQHDPEDATGLLLAHCCQHHLTHWCWEMHICIGKLTIVGADNGLLPSRRQAIIWTNAGMLLIRPLEANFNGILIEIHIFSFKRMHLKCSSGKWRPFSPGLNVLTCFTYMFHWASKINVGLLLDSVWWHVYKALTVKSET